MQVSNNFGLLSATVKIFQQILGLSTDILHSVKMSFNKFRTLSFKLKKQINIDELADKENFEMKRSYLTGNEIKTDLIACKIMGIRKPRTTPDLPRPSCKNILCNRLTCLNRHVKLDWLNLSLTAFKLKLKSIFLNNNVPDI